MDRDLVTETRALVKTLPGTQTEAEFPELTLVLTELADKVEHLTRVKTNLAEVLRYLHVDLPIWRGEYTPDLMLVRTLDGRPVADVLRGELRDGEASTLDDVLVSRA